MATIKKDGYRLGIDLPSSNLRTAVGNGSPYGAAAGAAAGPGANATPQAQQRPKTSPSSSSPQQGSVRQGSPTSRINLLVTPTTSTAGMLKATSTGGGAHSPGSSAGTVAAGLPSPSQQASSRPGTSGSVASWAPHTPSAQTRPMRMAAPSREGLSPGTSSALGPGSTATLGSGAGVARPQTAAAALTGGMQAGPLGVARADAGHGPSAGSSADGGPGRGLLQQEASGQSSDGGAPAAEGTLAAGRRLLASMQASSHSQEQTQADAIANMLLAARPTTAPTLALRVETATADTSDQAAAASATTAGTGTVSSPQQQQQQPPVMLLPSKSAPLSPSHKHLTGPGGVLSRALMDVGAQAGAGAVGGVPRRMGTRSAGALHPTSTAAASSTADSTNSTSGSGLPGIGVAPPTVAPTPEPAWSADALFRPRTVPVGATRQPHGHGMTGLATSRPASSLITAAGHTQSGGTMRPSTTPHSGRSPKSAPVQPVHGMFMDLLEATRKSFAAGMGEWHLQSLDWVNPAFKTRLLQGDIGPENLKAHYGLLEPDVLRLYRVLYLYSFGFCSAVMEPTERARDREKLLEAVFKAFAQLWDEALGISFQSEMVDVLRTKTDAVAAMQAMSSELEAVRAEHAELQQRLSQFVRSNIDNMLAYRQLQDRAATTQGEAAMLSATNDALAVRLVGAEVAREEAGLAVNTAATAQAAAEAQRRSMESALQKAKGALQEQQRVVAKHITQIRQLEQELLAARAQAGDLRAQKSTLEAELHVARSQGEGVHSQLADAARSYTLLHANWLVKDQELAALRAANQELATKVEHMQHTYATAKQQICEAREAERMYCCKWELGCKQLAEITETNKKLVARNAELVRSYWPLVARMREAEEQHAAQQATAAEAVAQRDSLQSEVELLRRQVDTLSADAASLHAAQQEMASNNSELPEPLLQSLPAAAAARLRVFFLAGAKRTEELRQQLVRLVDVQASSAYQHQQAEARSRELQRQLAVAQQQLQDERDSAARKLARARAGGAPEHAISSKAAPQVPSAGGFDVVAASGPQGPSAGAAGPTASAPPPAACEDLSQVVAELKVDLQEALTAQQAAEQRADAAESQLAQLTTQLEAMAAGSGSKDRWMQEAASQAERLAARIDSLLLQDPALPPATRACHTAGSSSNSSSSSSTAPGSLDASSAQDLQQQRQQEGSPPSSSSAAFARPESAASGPSRGIAGVATGPIAAALCVPGETRGPLVQLDQAVQGLGGALEQLLAWAQDAMDKKTQLELVAQLRNQAADASTRAASAEAARQQLQQQLKDAEERFAAADKRVADAASVAAACERRAEAAGATEAQATEDAQACRLELGSLQEKHVLMEEEYWRIKTQLLEAQLREAGLQTAHDRAMQEASGAAQALAAAQAEVAEQRALRQQLETDIVGLKAWIRTMQQTEVLYRQLLADHGRVTHELESSRAAAASLQHQLSSLQGAAPGTAPGAASAGVPAAEAERLRSVAATAAEAARASELARLELQSLLAETRRAAEAGADALRHAQHDVALAKRHEQEAHQQAEQQRLRADGLAVQLLQVQLERTRLASERGLALGALVDAQLAAQEQHLEHAPP